MSSLTASLCLAFVLLLRLGGVPGPLFSSPVLYQVWKLDVFLLADLFKGNPQSLRRLRIRTVTDCTVEHIYSYPHTKMSKDLVLFNIFSSKTFENMVFSKVDMCR